ncbi:MAG: PD40 domain-containing protein [Armatimonadetes bacterium]|nr:PD40 domain-containing protein [Armatimonadota bacterium]
MTLAAVAVLVAASVGATLWFTRPSGPAVAPVLTRLTSDSGLTFQPAISPDGKLLAYASDRGEEGNLDIWLEQIGGGQPIQLTRHEGDDTEPAFSPDGTKVAFRSERGDGGIYLVPALGGEPRLIAKQGHRPRFSPDGNWLAYWAGPIGNALMAGSTNTYILPSMGGEPIQLDLAFSATRHPIWSPDGKHLLLLGRLARGEGNGGLDWWLVPVDGGTPIKTGVLEALERQRLSPPPGELRIVPSSWPAGSENVAFAASLGDTTNLWELKLSPQTRKVTGPAARLTFGTGVEVQPSLASGPGGRLRLVFSDLRPNVDVWTVPIDANQGEVTGAMQRVTQNISFDGYPAISADGEKLAFISSRSGNWDVWTRDLKTGKEAPATATPLRELQPVLSRDGSTIFYWTNENQQRLVYKTNFRGGVATKLCEGCGTPTDVSNGYLLLEPIGGPQAFALIDLASNRITNLIESTRPDQIPFAGRFSPDGRWIAFHATTERPAAARQIFVVPFRGWPDESVASSGDWIPITDGEEMDRQSCWSPDGNLLYFLSDRDGFRCIWAQPLDVGAKRPDGETKSVLHFHGGRLSLRGVGNQVSTIKLSVARDQLVFALGELTGNIWMKDVQEQF